MKERNGGTIQLALNEENESFDGDNPFPEIIEEENSPTASSTSVNSSGLENPFFEHLEMEVNSHVQNMDGRVQVVGGEDGCPKTTKNMVQGLAILIYYYQHCFSLYFA